MGKRGCERRKRKITLILFTLSYLLCFFFFPSIARHKINSSVCLRKKSSEAYQFPFSIFNFTKRKSDKVAWHAPVQFFIFNEY